MTVRKQTEEKKRFSGARVTVIGAQRSGRAAAHLLQDRDIDVLLSDNDPAALPDETAAQLRDLGITVELGEHSDKVLESDLAVISPGIPDTAEVVRAIDDHGIPAISEIELASWFTQDPIIAVTGSNGKTTTSTLVAEFLNFGGFAPKLCGNIGHPFAQAVREEPFTSKKKFLWSK